MFEHSSLQEAYTGSLIAGKGKLLNNIKTIMDRSKFAQEDWARVRFGAGTPWRRCWCVISPPDEKEYNKAQKVLKKSSSYGRTQVPKGEIKFYDTRRITKKTKPIVTISDAYAAYAIYPQAKPLIDQSTLIKLEGLVTMHTSPETTSEGFVFVMPEVHAAVSGFEMMLRWLFPVYDTFALYGRPLRLIADTLDQRGLMFAMPKDRHYGYLDILDVSGLIHTAGSAQWTERQWRKELKKLTSTRMMNSMEDSPQNSTQQDMRRKMGSRISLPPSRPGARFDEGSMTRSSPGSRSGSPGPPQSAEGKILPARRTDSAPAPGMPMAHRRSVSEANGYRPSRLSHEASRPVDDGAPMPPAHGQVMGGPMGRYHDPGSMEHIPAGGYGPGSQFYDQPHGNSTSSPNLPPPGPVLSPPAFTHNPNSRPSTQPYQAPELRRAHSNVDAATLRQMQDAQRRDPRTDEDYSGHMRQMPPDSLGPEYMQEFDRNLTLDQSQGFAGGAANQTGSRPRDPRQRLSTIPGSPFVGDGGEYFTPSETSAMPQMDSVPEGYSPGEEYVGDAMGSSEQLHSSGSVARKPVPRKLPNLPSDEDQFSYESAQARQVRDQESSPPTSPNSENGSLKDAMIDQDALERILNDDSSRYNTLQSNVSSVTPDYASTASASTHHDKPPVEKPRAGRLKTVGDPGLPTTDVHSVGAGKLDTYNKGLAEHAAAVPTFDFGPTYSYKPTGRPGTSGTLTPGDLGEDRRSRSRSKDRLRESSRDRLSQGNLVQRVSPAESNRRSYFGGAVTPTGIERSDSPSHRHSIAWMPAAPASPGNATTNHRSLTPEQWVQYRAALAAQPEPAPPRRVTPTYAHQRQHSSSPSAPLQRQSMNKTPPPFIRSSSGDWSHWGRQTPPSRPDSRGAGTYLNQAGGRLTPTGTIPNLSAKEQMHVARATGTPLISLPNKSGKQPDEQSPNLINAIATREREKAAIKEGIRSDSVQQAIFARQQQQAQLEAEAQAQAKYAMQQRYQQAIYQNATMEQNQAHAQQQARLSWGPNRMSLVQQGYDVDSPYRATSPQPSMAYSTYFQPPPQGDQQQWPQR